MAENEKLTNNKADLLNKLQCYEEDLKTVNECENYIELVFQIDTVKHFAVLRMRERAISGMMTAHVRYTDVEEREKRINNLKKVKITAVVCAHCVQCL